MKRNKFSKIITIFLLVTASVLVFSIAAIVARNTNKSLVPVFTQLYDGDEQRAKEELDALYSSGIVDKNGQMIELDIREDGEKVALPSVAMRIASGENTGELTVNGYKTTTEQIVKLEMMREQLELARLLDNKVEITDEHVAGFKTLLTSLSEGTVLFSDEMNREVSYLKNISILKGTQTISEYPETMVKTDSLSVTNGTYRDKFISDGSYDANHNFSLANKENSTYYTDDRYDGIGVINPPSITVTCPDSITTKQYGSGSFVASDFDVKVKLCSPMEVPVSFDYQTGGAAYSSGTITWNPGESGEKTFNLEYVLKAFKGIRTITLNLSNLKNAIFSDGSTIFSKVIKVNDISCVLENNSYTIVRDSYYTASNLYGSDSYTNTVYNYDGTGYPGSYQFANATEDKGTKGTNTIVADWFPANATAMRISITAGIYLANSFTLQSSNKFGYISLTVADPTKDFNVNSYRTEANYLTNQGIDSYYIGIKDYNSDYIYNGTSRPTGQVTATFNFDSENFLHLIKNGKLRFIIDSMQDVTNIKITKVEVTYFRVPTTVSVSEITAPAKTYHYGELIPISVKFNKPVVANKDTKLTINGTQHAILGLTGNEYLESDTLTFGYIVKAVDTGSVNITAISGLKTHDNGNMIVSNEARKSLGAADGIIIDSDVKKNSIDFSNVKYGIDEGNVNQIVTIVLPIKSGSEITWIINESVSCKTSGNGISMTIPSYGTVQINNYLSGEYFTYDGGMTRYPIYVVTSENETPIALVSKFSAPKNYASYVRKDTVELYLVTEIVTEQTAYLPEWNESKVDELGYHYFVCGTETTGSGNKFTFNKDSKYAEGEVLLNAVYSYFVKDTVTFNPTKYTNRSQTYTLAENGFIKLSNGKYVQLQDIEHPERQYDVEFVISEGLYNALKLGYTRMDKSEQVVGYQLSDRVNFTFTDKAYFNWNVSEQNIIEFGVDDNNSNQAELIFKNATSEKISIILNVLNGALPNETSFKTYSLEIGKFGVAEGKDPFLSIPKNSQNRTTLTSTETDIMFASNLTARNAAAGQDLTTFTLKLYRVDAVGTIVSENAEVIWTGTEDSTVENTSGHVTIPSSVLSNTGVYAAIVSATYIGNENSFNIQGKDFSAIAYLTVKQGPAKISLSSLESYSVMDTNIPTISYTVNSSNAQVEYTIQKSGEDVSERKSISGGVIPFTAGTPTGLKDIYVITVYARIEDGASWSMDSLVLTIYNHDALDLIIKDVVCGEIGGTTGGTGTVVDDTTVIMTNEEKVLTYLKENGYELTFSDFTLMRTDISLQKIVSVNYGSGVWGIISDKMQWSSSNPDAVSVDYEQGGIYSDIRNYRYTSYSPISDFLIVGKQDATDVTISATHAETGMTSSFKVTTKTLKNKLYVLQFYPKTVTSVSYTNGNGKKRLLNSNEEGQIAVYEPYGISGNLMALSQFEGNTYVRTVFDYEFETGEADIASLQLYPCNNIRMRLISNITLSVVLPNGTPYNGKMIIRGGVYKNDIYCPDALIKTNNLDAVGKNGRENISVTVYDGKINLWFDPSQFRTSTNDDGLLAGDTVAYVFEYSLDNYQTGYTILNVATDLAVSDMKPTDSLIELKSLRGAGNMPQIVKQTLQQYYGEEHTPNGYTKDVTDFNENIGISKEFNMVRLFTDVVLMGEKVGIDDSGYSIYNNSVVDFAIYTSDGRKLNGQTESSNGADQILNLSDLYESKFFVFPFSSTPMVRSTYLMTDETLSSNKITNYDQTVIVKAIFKRGDVIVRQETLPYGIANLSRLPDPKDDTETIGEEIKEELEEPVSLGDAFKDINVNEVLKQGFVFLGSMQKDGSKYAPHIIILPTENPETFRILAFIGYDKSEGDENQGFSVNYDPNAQKEDVEKFKKALKELAEKEKENNKKNKDKKEDNGLGGEGEMEFNFYGAIQLETRWDAEKNRWVIDFTGGNVGANIAGKYEWSETFMCGPYPFLLSLGVGFNADVEVAFGNKENARAMLLDAAFGVSIEAFAGLGFDLSIVEFKLGIFGEIGADFNFLYLTQGKGKVNNKTGEKLDITGEIGIQIKIKLLFVSYSENICSTKFINYSKKWHDYDNIRQFWEDGNYSEMYGVTKSGRKFTMMLFKDGSAMVAVENGAELETRDYLDLKERAWNSGATGTGDWLRLTARSVGNELKVIQTNAYPYSNPVFTEDGSMFVYLSDNDNAKKLQSAVSFAVKNGDSYQNMGRIDPDDTILADMDLVVSGSGNDIFTAWIRQMESPERENNANITNDDLGMMMSATEIYVSKFNGNTWETFRLTENYNADMSPTVASYGNRAIVAWRSLDASSMPKGSDIDLTAMFNVENNIMYRIYNGSNWIDAQIAYNGSAGTVNAIDSKMMANGSAILVYTVRTGDEVTSTETFYTMINTDGSILTSGRLTNDNYSDVNAKVAVVGNQFVVAWYSEHDSNLKSGENEVIAAHDIRLARINSNGSIDSTFIESIDGKSSSSITSDFRLSSPINNTDLNNLSIVWSNRKNSNAEEDAGKYEINAVRFYQFDNTIGVTAVNQISETSKYFTIDHFDTYTDSSGKIYTLVLGSDYNEVENISYFDTIDFSEYDNHIEYRDLDGESILNILSAETISYIKLGSGEIPQSVVSATIYADLYELVPGLDLPLQFSIVNTGTSVVNEVTIVGGGLNKTFNNLSLLPNQATSIIVNYPVPLSHIQDLVFTITPNNGDAVTAEIILNNPDVAISGVRVIRESNGTRDIKIVLGNASNIPLENSGKVVKLAIYSNSARTYQVGETITIDPSCYADIDRGVFTIIQTVNLKDFLTRTVDDWGSVSYSDFGRAYVYAWVDDVDEIYIDDNYESVLIRRLDSKLKDNLTIDTALVERVDGSYEVKVEIRNNKFENVSIPFMVELLDISGNQIAIKMLSNDVLNFEIEERKTDLSVTFTKEEIGNNTPTSVNVISVQKVYIDFDSYKSIGWKENGEYVYSEIEYFGENNESTRTVYYVLTNQNGQIEHLPIPIDNEESGEHFTGWYSWRTHEFVDNNYIFTKNGERIYAGYSRHNHNYTYQADGATITAVCSAEDHDNWLPNSITIVVPTLKHENGTGNPNATLTGRIDEVKNPEIVYKQGNTVLSSAPTTKGTYTANITLGGATASVEYTITAPMAEVIVIPTDRDLVYDETEQQLINLGSAVGGTLKYAIGTNSETAPEEGWSTNIPMGTNASIYYVWYKVFANEGYIDSEPKCVIVLIRDSGALKYLNYTFRHGETNAEKVEVPEGYVELTSNEISELTTGWYVVKQNITVNGKLTINGQVNIVICDGVTLTVNDSITVREGSTFNIYGQIGKMGNLIVENPTNSGIIINNSTVNIYGINLTVTGGRGYQYTQEEWERMRELHGDIPNNIVGFPAIDVVGANLNIYGGNIIANGNQQGGDAIKCSSTENRSSVIDVYGGNLTLTGGESTEYSNGGSAITYDEFGGIKPQVNINGGTINATGNDAGCFDNLDLTINNGTVNVNGETSNNGILRCKVVINGGVLRVRGYQLIGHETSFEFSSESKIYYSATDLNPENDDNNLISKDDITVKAQYEGKCKYLTIITEITSIEYIDYTEYSFNNGKLESKEKDVPNGYINVSSINLPTTFENGYYVITESVTYNDLITISGEVYLIIKNGAILTATKGIFVTQNNKLYIYEEIGGNSEIIVTGADDHSGIGADYGTNNGIGGEIYIHGVKITATGGFSDMPGISAQVVTIFAGNITATGSGTAAGIGSSSFSDYTGTVTIYGGNVVAIGGQMGDESGDGIGSGFSWYDSNKGTLILGPGIGMLDEEDETLAEALNEIHYCIERAGYMKTGTPKPPEPLEPVNYSVASWNDNKVVFSTETCSDYKKIKPNTKTLTTGWYAVTENLELSNRITIEGEVNIIILDGVTLTANSGIELVEGNILNIYSQSEGTGILNAFSSNSAIGCTNNRYSAGTLVVFGGTINASSGYYSAGIGGNYSDGGSVTIYSGTINANGGMFGAGIGGGHYGNGGNVTIYGGTVYAIGGERGAGIGGGNEGNGGNVTIYGGIVYAIGGTSEYDSNEYGNGIGAGYNGGNNGTLLINNYSMIVFAGDSEHPENDSNNLVELKNDDYDRNRYMTIKTNSHEHHFVYSIDQEDPSKIIATCDAEGCLLQDRKTILQLTISSNEIVYNGNPHPVTYNSDWLGEEPDIKYYVISNTGKRLLDSAPVEVSVEYEFYIAEATVGGVTAVSRNYRIISQDSMLTITNVVVVDRKYQQWRSDVSILTIEFDNAELIYQKDYSAYAHMDDDQPGKNKNVTVEVHLYSSKYTLSNTVFYTTVNIYGEDEDVSDRFVNTNLFHLQGSTATVDIDLPDGTNFDINSIINIYEEDFSFEVVNGELKVIALRRLNLGEYVFAINVTGSEEYRIFITVKVELSDERDPEIENEINIELSYTKNSMNGMNVKILENAVINSIENENSEIHIECKYGMLQVESYNDLNLTKKYTCYINATINGNDYHIPVVITPVLPNNMNIELEYTSGSNVEINFPESVTIQSADRVNESLSVIIDNNKITITALNDLDAWTDYGFNIIVKISGETESRMIGIFIRLVSNIQIPNEMSVNLIRYEESIETIELPKGIDEININNYNCDLEISVNDNVVTIKANKDFELNEGPFYFEIEGMSFHNRFTITVTINIVDETEPDEPKPSINYREASWNNSNNRVKFTEKTCEENSYNIVGKRTKEWNNGRYVVNKDTEILNRIIVTGEVDLIIYDGVTLNAKCGIAVDENATLTIYGQTNGTGRLIAETEEYYQAGIGSSYETHSGNIIIHGGNIIAKGGYSGAGIGSSYKTHCGNITIFGGIVTATGGDYAAGIGTGDESSGGNITIFGGNITATGGESGAGIGCGSNGNITTITINNGTIIATGFENGSGIGGSYSSSIESIIINGGTITAIGGDYAAGIGGGYYSNGPDITINGGTVYAIGGENTVAIGKGAYADSDGKLTLADSSLIYVSDNPNPEDNEENLISLENGDYIRKRYMTVIAPENQGSNHEHNFTYTAKGDTITATCSEEDCYLENNVCTLTLNDISSVYTGSRVSATYSSWDAENPIITYYQVTESGEITNGTLLSGAPTDVGFYYVEATIGDAKAVRSFEITPKTISIIGANLTSRDYEQNNKNVAVESVTFDGTNLTLGTDYTATAEMETDTAGTKTAIVTVNLLNNNYDIEENTYNSSVVINKATYTGEKEKSGYLRGTTDETTEITLPNLPLGASFGTIINNNDEYFTVSDISNGKVIVTASKDFDEETESESRTFTVSVTSATNYNDYVITVTVIPTFRGYQVIDSSNIIAIYGDTNLQVSANLIEGNGTLSYSVKNGESVSVNELTGEVTTLKVGTTIITIKASQTDKYVETEIDITVTVNPRVVVINWTNTNNLVYNKTAQKPTATVTNLVNNDVVGLKVAGEQINAGTYTATASFASEQINYIFPEVVTTEYSILEKEITVTIENKTSEYGEDPKTLTAIVKDGAIESGDKDVYKLSCEVTKTSGVKTYVITGEDISLNYKVTFVNGNYEVTKKVLTITAEDKTAIYGDEKPNYTLIYNGFVNNEDETILAGELEIICEYEQFGDIGEYTITPSGYISGNYEITYATGTLTVVPKAITVRIVNKTSVYGEAQVELTATDNGIVNNDEVYTLACEVTETSNVGTYNITGTAVNANYTVTFANEENAYEVTKRHITATAEDKTIKFGEEIIDLTFTLGEEEIDKNVLAELTEKLIITCDADSSVSGKYSINMSFNNDYTSETVLENYEVTLENGNFYVLAKVLENNGVEVTFENTEEAFDYEISVEVEIIETETEQSLDYDAISKQYVARRQEISKVYSVKLLRSEIVNGEETLVEIQPKDINDGTVIIIKIQIPEELIGRNFRILHIHSAEDIEYVDESNIEVKDGFAYVKVNRLSEFAFVNLKDNEEMNHKSFCMGWLLFIFNCLLAAFYFVFIILKRKKPLGLVGLISACVVLAYAIIAISLHLCVITIISFVVAVVLFAAWLTMYLFDKNKPDENDKDGTSETSANEEIEPAAEAQEQVQDELSKQPAEIPTEDTTASSDDEEDGGVVVNDKGNYFNIRYNKSFTAKLIQSSDEIKGYYGELKNEALSYNKTKSRVSWSYDSINSGRAPVVKFGIRGKTLCVYFPLNAEELDDKYKVETVESAKYEAVPCMYRIKNERRLRYAKELIAKVCETLGLTKGDDQHEDYYLSYESTEVLIAKGLIKELKTQVTDTQIKRAKQEGTIRIVGSVSVGKVNDLISNEVAAAAIIKGETHATGKKDIVNVDVLSVNFNDGDTVTIERLKEKKIISSSVCQVKLLARGVLDKKLHVELQDYSIEAVKMILATGGTVKKA